MFKTHRCLRLVVLPVLFSLLKYAKIIPIHRQQFAAHQKHPCQQVLRYISFETIRENFSCHKFSLLLSSSYTYTQKISYRDLCWSSGMLPAICCGLLAQASSDPPGKCRNSCHLKIGYTCYNFCMQQICSPYFLERKSSLYFK